MAKGSRLDVLPPMVGEIYSRALATASETYRAPLHWTAGAYVTFINSGAVEPVLLQWGDSPDLEIGVIDTRSDLSGLTLVPRSSTALKLGPGQSIVFRSPYADPKRETWFFAVGGNVGAEWTAYRSSHPAPITVTAPEDLPTIALWRTDTGLTGNPNISEWEDKIQPLAVTPPGTPPTRLLAQVNGHDAIAFAQDSGQALTGAIAGAELEDKGFSIVCVCRRDGQSNAEQGIVSVFAAGNASEVTLGRTGRRPFLTRSDSAGTATSTAISPNTMGNGQLIVLIGVVTENQIRLYENTAFVAGDTVNTDPSGIDSVSIGNQKGDADAFGGDIFEVLLIDEAIGDKVIQELVEFYTDYYGAL